MKNLIVAASVVLGITSFLKAAEPGTPPMASKTYLSDLQVKLDHAARRANQPTSGSTNVIGLRGSKQEPLSKQLYWKGEKGPEAVSPEEVKVFRAAVEQANTGQTAEAVPALKAFVDKYPQSPLKSDAEEALRVLSSAQ